MQNLGGKVLFQKTDFIILLLYDVEIYTHVHISFWD